MWTAVLFPPSSRLEEWLKEASVEIERLRIEAVGGVLGVLEEVAKLGEGRVVICLRGEGRETEVRARLSPSLRDLGVEVEPVEVGSGPEAVPDVSDVVVKAAQESKYLCVDVSGAELEVLGVLTGIAVSEVPSLEIEEEPSVRLVAWKLEGDALVDVTRHLEAAMALIWASVCAWHPSHAAAERAVKLARCSGVRNYDEDMEWLREYAEALAPALAGKVLTKAEPERESLRAVRDALKRVFAVD